MKSAHSLPKTLNNTLADTRKSIDPAFENISKFFASLFSWVSASLEALFKSLSYTPILVIILVVAAYLIGSYRTEIQYLKQNGGVLAAQNTNPQVGSAAPAVVATPPAPVASVAPISDKDHVWGSKNAKVVLVEYSDYECPFCKNFHSTIKQVQDKYADSVAIVYRHFPLSFHANAQKEAEASECINELGGNEAFWKYTDTIFERTTSNGNGFALDQLGPLASELGLNRQAFQQCLDSGKYAQRVQADMTEGQAAGVQGTPTSYLLVGGKSVKSFPGALPFAQVSQDIDTALKQ